MVGFTLTVTPGALFTTFLLMASCVVTKMCSRSVLSIVLNLVLVSRMIYSIVSKTSFSMAVTAAAVKPQRPRADMKAAILVMMDLSSKFSAI